MITILLKFEHKHSIMKGELLDWYLLQAKPNGHIRAVDNLKRQGFEVFAPHSQNNKERKVSSSIIQPTVSWLSIHGNQNKASSME